MDITDRLIDKTTVLKNHTVWTHLFCILLRITLGISIIKGWLSLKSASYLAIIIVLVFGRKFITNNKTWKVYLRTTLVYTIVMTTRFTHLPKEIVGTLVIVDALMGLQSRRIAKNFLA